jgi:tryptophan synthase alpha chain
MSATEMAPSRIGRRFAELRQAGRVAFVGFITAGDPSLDRTVELALRLEDGGVDVLELGVPFSDPLADGPVIQRSSQRALEHGATLPRILEVVGRIREKSELPLLLFSYLNPLLRMGLQPLAESAQSVGLDGVLVTDLPPEEAQDWIAAARAHSLDTVFLAAPTSPEERLKRVAEACRGFVYAVSRTGVTGERVDVSADAAALVGRLRERTGEPVALGFGISTPDQVAQAASLADGVVVGSSLVRFLEENADADITEHVRWLKSGI